MEFKIVIRPSEGELAAEVAAFLAVGWEPLGGVAVNPPRPKRPAEYMRVLVRHLRA
jgi:hypothetical protein